MSGACDNQGGPAPANSIIKETMTIEYDYIEGFDAGSDDRAFPEIRDNVRQAFMQTGTIFDPRRDTHALPFYQNDPNFKFPDEDGNALAQYAEDNRHPIDGFYMNYHYLSVNYAISNVGALLQLPAVSVQLRGFNQSQLPEERRCTFLFWGDVVTKLSSFPLDIKRTAVTASAHELGHQRMGLTHVEDYAQYHNSGQYSICVMRANLSGISTSPTDYQLNPVFCYDNDSDDSNSCLDWLKKANP
jgi:hypothetical protein